MILMETKKPTLKDFENVFDIKIGLRKVKNKEFVELTYLYKDKEEKELIDLDVLRQIGSCYLDSELIQDVNDDIKFGGDDGQF